MPFGPDLPHDKVFPLKITEYSLIIREILISLIQSETFGLIHLKRIPFRKIVLVVDATIVLV